MAYYIERGGKTIGPIQPAELREMARAGNVTPATRVKQNLVDPWLPAGKLQGLFHSTPVEPSGPPPATAVNLNGSLSFRDDPMRTYPAVGFFQGLLRVIGGLEIVGAVLLPVAVVVTDGPPSPDEVIGLLIYSVAGVIGGIITFAFAELLGMARNIAADIQRLTRR